MIGQSLAESNIRARTGASIIALVRDRQVMANPKSSAVFAEGDLVGLIGTDAQVVAVEALLQPEPTSQATNVSIGSPLVSEHVVEA